MKIDNVTFVESEVKKLTKEKFIEMHIGVLWQNISETERRKKLTDVYERIAGKPKKQESAAETE